MLKKLSLLILIFTSTTASAVVHIGNGGDVVICRDSSGKTTSIELLDFYEGRVLREMTLDLGSANLSVEQKLQLVFSRMERLDPARVRLYRQRALSFISESIIKSGLKLSDVPDSGHLSFPANCSVEQIAIQRRPEFPEDRLYIINLDLWNELNNDNKAGLILHELILRELLETWNQGSANKGPLDIADAKRLSRWARYVQAYITSDKFEYLTPAEYQTLIRQAINERDGGGALVICDRTAGTPETLDILDFYEAKEFRSIAQDLPPAANNRDAIIDAVLNRLNRLDPTRVATYRAWHESFLAEAKFQTDVELVTLPDNELLGLPVRCKIKQVVIQRISNLQEPYRYLIDKDLWDRLSPMQQAGLVMHELLNRDALSAKPMSYVAVRYFNSYIFSKNFEAMSASEYLDVLKRIGI